MIAIAALMFALTALGLALYLAHVIDKIIEIMKETAELTFEIAKYFGDPEITRVVEEAQRKLRGQ